MKKTSGILLLMLLLTAVLTACGGDKATPTPELIVPTSPVDAPTNTPATLPPAQVITDAALTGQPWQWVELFDQATGAAAIADPQNYLVDFQPDGIVTVKADCNNASGDYTVNGDSLSIVLGPTTLAACAPESMSDQFLAKLGGAAKYNIANGRLQIELIADSGTMTFISANATVPPEGVPTAAPPNPTTPPVAPTVAPIIPTPPPGSAVDSGSRDHAAGTYQAPYYTIALGDTLYSISLRFGVSVEQIKAANGMSGNTLISGSQLRIPGAGEVLPVTPPPSSGNYERVNFDAGSVSATRNGSIDNNTPKGYVIRALAGQSMQIQTTSSAEYLILSVKAENGQLLTLNGVNGQAQNNVAVQLPYTGDYFITVTPNTAPESPSMAFTITFTVQ